MTGGSRVVITLWTLTLVYAAARVLQAFPEKVSMLAIVALHVIPPALFAIIHGTAVYRLRGILTFAALCFLVGNAFENLSILTGFPFGHYHFTDLMGPKLFHVPLLLGLAYVGMGYLSWTLAGLILQESERPLAGWRPFTLPVVASFIMVAWDVSMDPVWSTILHGWIWHQGGAYFGVPISNFLGWYLTVYIFYQLFALYLQARSIVPRPVPMSYRRLAVLFYAISAAGNLLVIPSKAMSVVLDPSGASWRVSNIMAASAVTSIFTMGSFAAIAWVRLADRRSLVRPSL